MRRRRRPGVTIGPGVRLGRDVEFDPAWGGTIVLEPGSAIGRGARLLARGAEICVRSGAVLGDDCTLLAHAGISVGPGARLADGVTVVDFQHVIEDPETPIRLQGLDGAPVTIGARAVLGPRAAVLKGVSVGEGALVGAHAVVTRDVPPGARVGGVPARAIPAEPGRPSTATIPPG